MRPERSHPEGFGGAAPRPRSGSSRSAERQDRAGAGGRDQWAYDRPDPRASRDRPASRDRRPPGRAAAPQRGVRGAIGVLLVFLVTLAGAGADSYVGMGLGLITTIALVGSVVVAALVVRRRDLGTIVVAPPLVFVGVALVNIALAPSATFSPTTMATLMIRGFPAMALAAAAALVLTVIRAIARR